jgi:hypothetical protein
VPITDLRRGGGGGLRFDRRDVDRGEVFDRCFYGRSFYGSGFAAFECVQLLADRFRLTEQFIELLLETGDAFIFLRCGGLRCGRERGQSNGQ